MNKLSIFRNTAFVGVLLMLTSCEAIGGIFKAGMWSGILMVALVIGLIIWLLGRVTKK